MGESKSFPVSAALSVTTGRMLGKFSDMHELAEWLIGHPIWTHEFADPAMNDVLRADAIEQHPILADTAAPSTINADNWEAWLAVEVRRIGRDTLDFTKGSGVRSEHPIQSLERIALAGGSKETD